MNIPEKAMMWLKRLFVPERRKIAGLVVECRTCNARVELRTKGAYTHLHPLREWEFSGGACRGWKCPECSKDLRAAVEEDERLSREYWDGEFGTGGQP